MTVKANYTVAADALSDWRDSLFNGTRPVLYDCGACGSIELGPEKVVLIGGLPGGGKSALAMQLTIDALRATPELRAAVASVEMSTAVILDRQLARLAGIPLDIIAHRQLDGTHAERIDRGLSTLESIADRLAFVGPPYDLGNIAAVADDFRGELLVLDYLQRIKPPGEHTDRRHSVDALMDFLRQFADAGCAVLCVSAMARTKDSRGRSSYDGGGLSLASFRESSELEYGADTCYALVPAGDDPESATLRCLKHRHGEPADIVLRFERRFQRFTAADATLSESERAENMTRLAVLWNQTPAADDDAGGRL